MANTNVMPHIPQEIRDKIFHYAMPAKIQTLEEVEQALRMRGAYFSTSIGRRETDLPPARLNIDFKITRQGRGLKSTPITTLQLFSLKVDDLLKVCITSVHVRSSTIAHYSRDAVGAEIAQIVKWVDDYTRVAGEDISVNCGSMDKYIYKSTIRQIEEKTSLRFMGDRAALEEPSQPTPEERDSRLREEQLLAIEYSKEERRKR